MTAELSPLDIAEQVISTFPPPGEPEENDDAYVDWIQIMAEKGQSPNTIYVYAQTVSDFLRFVKKPISQINEVDIRAYSRHLQEQGKAPYTVQNYLTRVGIFLKAMGNPINVYRFAPKGKFRVPEYLTPEEVKKFIDAIDESILDGDEPDPELAVMRFKALFTLLPDTGLRVSEACNLRKVDIDFGERLITVVKGKRDKYRKVPVSKSTLELIQKYWGMRKDKLPFAFEYKGRKLDRMSVWRFTREIAHKAGIDKVTRTHGENIHPHIFRHTFATVELKRLISSGKNRMDAILVIKEALGHTDIRTTMIYLTLLGEDIRDIMGR